jgi:hypothetical protein
MVEQRSGLSPQPSQPGITQKSTPKNPRCVADFSNLVFDGLLIYISKFGKRIQNEQTWFPLPNALARRVLDQRIEPYSFVFVPDSDFALCFLHRRIKRNKMIPDCATRTVLVGQTSRVFTPRANGVAIPNTNVAT